MNVSKTANMVLISVSLMGHLVPAMELAKQLVARDPLLSITVLLIKFLRLDDKLQPYILYLKSNSYPGIKFIDMPLLDDVEIDFTTPKKGFMSLYLEAYKSKVKDVVERLRDSSHAPVVGLLLDMFCTAMVDVATELDLPSYIFFTSGASLLRMMLHFQGLVVDVAQEYDVVQSPNTTLEIPGFRNPMPVSALPGIFLNKDRSSADFLRHAERYRLAKGIIVNTFYELERRLIDSILEDKRIPPIYSAGPILNLATDDESSSLKDSTMRWLETQPPRSVVFLCFGSRGCFNDTQVKEIAIGLERSGQRFLWSLRQQPKGQGGGMVLPLEFDDVGSVLPEGFLERTAERGRVIGWAAQSKILAHKAVGAFVSHCGWNSMLESIWFGVPIVTWPIYAEQQLNAFVLVKELGLATEIRVDYRQDFGIYMVVGAEEVEDGIRKVMDEAMELRKKVKEMSEKARKASRENGSSYKSLGQFIDDVFLNLP